MERQGCCAEGTGSLSGNSHTCHHSCMLVKSVRRGAAGEAATAIRRMAETTTHIRNRWVKWKRAAVLLYKVVNVVSEWVRRDFRWVFLKECFSPPLCKFLNKFI